MGESKELLYRIGEMLTASTSASCETELCQAGSSDMTGDAVPTAAGDEEDASESAAWACALEVLQQKMGRLHARRWGRESSESATASSVPPSSLPSHGSTVGKRPLLTGDAPEGAQVSEVQVSPAAQHERRKSSRRSDDRGRGATGLTMYAADALSFVETSEAEGAAPADAVR